MSNVGTISRGIKAPIIRKGDDIAEIAVKCLLDAAKSDNFKIQDNDVYSLTEAVVARAENNYASLNNITKDIKQKTGGKTVGLLFPILSRNRFSAILKAISAGVEKLIIQLSYPDDEVGNPLIPKHLFLTSNINPNITSYTVKEFRKTFGATKHPFTGVDYISLYQKIAGKKATIILSNNPKEILKYTNTVIVANVHLRDYLKEYLLNNGAKVSLNLADILNQSIDGSGYNPEYGLYGANLATDQSVKLFPRSSQKVVEKIAKLLKEKTGKNVHVMVYGDGAFKDPIGGIWELADPVVSPGFTKGLKGTPKELKLKYIADNKLGNCSKDEIEAKVKKYIKDNKNKQNKQDTLGTTPRQLTDLLGSLSDLTSGSGDKGTPFVYIQNYFNTYAN